MKPHVFASLQVVDLDAPSADLWRGQARRDAGGRPRLRANKKRPLQRSEGERPKTNLEAQEEETQD